MSSTTFAEKLLSGLQGISEYAKVRKQGEYIAASARFPSSAYDKIFERIEARVEPIIRNGEKIINEISKGEIIDSGVRQFSISRGVFMEVYDYTSNSAIFIRLYQITDGENNWLSLYVDENPSTPWWDDE
jgi:hypothetical protein